MPKSRRVLLLSLVISVSPLAAACGGSKTATSAKSPTVSSQIKLAPAFSAAELAAAPGANWISPSGGTTGDRYSSLTQIDPSNASSLKGDWMTELNGSGAEQKYSQEGSPVEYEGVIYLPTGADDVFALSAASGKILWENRGEQPASLASAICCGWDNRGVALGAGKVYSVLLDDEVEALNQQTGKLEWKTKLASPAEAYTMTMAPLYADGMVFAGPSGAEYGIRGRMDALNAETGKLVWTHWNIPGPGEPGHESWPSTNNEWEHGGASTWNTPTVDPELGLIYYSTSNAGDDDDGRERAGNNLYTASIIALHIKTGEMAWYYQEVHHDIWDYDATSPTVLINAEVNGKMVEGIAQPSKTGYVYFLDRKTGKPVFPIPERAVPQSALEHTSATQPIPTMAPFSPVHVTPVQQQELQKAIDSAMPSGQKPPKVIPGESFTPWGLEGEPTIQSSSNDNIGGDNWPPSSYDPSNSYYYVCSQSGATSFSLPRTHTAYKQGETYAGTSPIVGFLGFDTPGFLTAYDMKTGKMVWQKSFPKESCYGGVVSTAGGVVFAGRNNGDLVAYDANSGQQLWSFQTGAGADAPVAVYERAGEEYVVELDGGNALAGASHGDRVWQWSLNGTKGPVAPGSAAKAIHHAGTTSKTKEEEEAHSQEESRQREASEQQEEPEKKQEAPRTAQTPSSAAIAAGKELFTSDCSTCHGIAGTGGNGGPNLNSMPRAKSISGVVAQLTAPLGAMPSFNEQLSAQEKEELADYVTSEITHSVSK